MSFQGSNKVFFHLKIVGEEVKLLPVHFHFLQKDREWVHSKFDSVIKDFKRLVLNNLDSIARAPAKGASSYLAFHKIAGGKRITIVYATTKADENTCIVHLNNTTGLSEPLHIASFQLIAWVFPLSDRHSPLQLLANEYYV